MNLIAKICSFASVGPCAQEQVIIKPVHNVTLCYLDMLHTALKNRKSLRAGENEMKTGGGGYTRTMVPTGDQYGKILERTDVFQRHLSILLDGSILCHCTSRLTTVSVFDGVISCHV